MPGSYEISLVDTKPLRSLLKLPCTVQAVPEQVTTAQAPPRERQRSFASSSVWTMYGETFPFVNSQKSVVHFPILKKLKKKKNTTHRSVAGVGCPGARFRGGLHGRFRACRALVSTRPAGRAGSGCCGVREITGGTLPAGRFSSTRLEFAGAASDARVCERPTTGDRKTAGSACYASRLACRALKLARSAQAACSFADSGCCR